MKAGHLFIYLVVGFAACKNKNVSTDNIDLNADTTHFFQVTEYLGTQIQDVKSTPYYIYKIQVENNNHRDSLAITINEFTGLASHFLTPDINDGQIKRFYRESVFFDQTTASYTLSYVAAKNDLEIRNLDVLLEDDAKTVKRIFIRKFINYGDSTAIEQLGWKPGESFQVNRLVERPGGHEISRQIEVVWNKKL